MSYTQLTQEQRYQIYELYTVGHKQTEIADKLKVHKSTISREIKRNRGLRGYRPNQAHQLAQTRKSQKVTPIISQDSWRRVEALLQEDWSPEQVSGWLAVNENILVSHEWIYIYIYDDKSRGGTLFKHLRSQKKRRKRYGKNDRRGALKNRVSISERPSVVDRKTRIGDWEADTVCGRQSGSRLVTLSERKSLFTLAGLVASKQSDVVTKELIKLLEPYAEKVHTITYDNGKEFAGHIEVSEATNSKGYFANPYSSWERGLNENTNGLLRQYFPKGANFGKFKECDIIKAVDKLNNRPRKTLGYKTPNQVFLGIDPPVALAS